MKHIWLLDSAGKPEYIEQGGEDGGIQHGGPHCSVCDEYFCQHEIGFEFDMDNCEGPDAA